MLYTDEELRAWWGKLAEAHRQELFQKMVERAPSDTYSVFAQSLREQYESGKTLTTKQLNAIRKWDRY